MISFKKKNEVGLKTVSFLGKYFVIPTLLPKVLLTFFFRFFFCLLIFPMALHANIVLKAVRRGEL